MEKEIKKLAIRGITDTCPVCGYTDGFHVSFKDEVHKLKIILICPECHVRFDPTWEIPRTILQKVE
ncbi:hypothetical protein [[Eubacterium] cellulosolvens]